MNTNTDAAKKRKILSISCAAAGILLVIGIYFFTGYLRSTKPSASPVSDTPVYEYILRDYHGQLAVFQPGKESPEIVFEVRTSTLPEYDQDALKDGIGAKDFEDLNRLIEDYIS